MAKTRDALKIIDHLIGDDAELRRMIEEEMINAAAEGLTSNALVAELPKDDKKPAGGGGGEEMY